MSITSVNRELHHLVEDLLKSAEIHMCIFNNCTNLVNLNFVDSNPNQPVSMLRR